MTMEQLSLELDFPSVANQKRKADKVIVQADAMDGSGGTLVTQWCNTVTISEYNRSGAYKSVDVSIGLLDDIMEKVTRCE